MNKLQNTQQLGSIQSLQQSNKTIPKKDQHPFNSTQPSQK